MNLPTRYYKHHIIASVILGVVCLVPGIYLFRTPTMYTHSCLVSGSPEKCRVTISTKTGIILDKKAAVPCPFPLEDSWFGITEKVECSTRRGSDSSVGMWDTLTFQPIQHSEFLFLTSFLLTLGGLWFMLFMPMIITLCGP